MQVQTVLYSSFDAFLQKTVRAVCCSDACCGVDVRRSKGREQERSTVLLNAVCQLTFIVTHKRNDNECRDNFSQAPLLEAPSQRARCGNLGPIARGPPRDGQSSSNSSLPPEQ